MLCSIIRNNAILLGKAMENIKWCCGAGFNMCNAKMLWVDHTKKKKSVRFDTLAPDVFWGFLGKWGVFVH